ncbi:MAG: helix-turn-helix transcriptional regulator [Armatimonadetes bacterium]|nr:helix-turn-helix transcriptional regulator [Armatimonadota bacterium]
MLEWAAQGYTDKEIAVKMQIAPGTVKTYWGRIRGKLNVANRAAAVAVVRPYVSDHALGIENRPIDRTEWWQAVLKVSPVCMAVLDSKAHVIAASLPGPYCRIAIQPGSALTEQLPPPLDEAVDTAVKNAVTSLEQHAFDVPYDRKRLHPDAFCGTVSPVVSSGTAVALLVTFQYPGRRR